MIRVQLPTSPLVGCAGVVFVWTLSAGMALGLLYVAVLLVKHAWGGT